MSIFQMRYVIWFYFDNVKNVKSTHGVVLLLVKLQAKATLRKVRLLHGCFSGSLNCANGTKSRNAPHLKIFEKD